jgi:hypothetical protein
MSTDPTPTDWPTLEQQHAVVLELLGMSLDLENDLDRTAAAVRRFWRDWPESRRQSVRALSSFLADAIEELCGVVSAREDAKRRRDADDVH